MGNFLETLLKFLGDLWPMVKVEPWEKGLRIWYVPGIWKLSKPRTVIEELDEGSHFFLWYFSEIHAESTVPQVMDLLSQTVTLKDGSVVSYSVNVEYEIDDVLKNTTEVHNFSSSLEATARIHFAKRIREMENFQQLLDKQKWLENSLADTLTTRVKRWGAIINDVGFTDLAPSKVYRLLGDSKYV